ncbi:MurR/RpiR family transcriptional regulator [Bacillus massiliigorillae]|uniref:MurR/RpiR family transcriptional regulator n=1 Tax=Bacillus massiliigorillae TaxID=1243664 RepID=UPI0003A93A1D|nr:MurR/RpiR family transcriptional regulator [Bacillus massiliigorillae]
MPFFLKKLVQHSDQLSQLEKQVLEYILRNPERVTELNVQELSKEIFVSTATISRTCKQLGFQGFQDMKYTLRKSANLQNEHQQIQAQSTSSFTLASHIKRIKEEFDTTLQLIDEEKIKLAAKYIHESPQVEFMGLGNSLPTCVDAARKLVFAGKLCNAREDWDVLKSVSNSLTENDLAILVSYSGETLNMLKYAHILKSRNVKTIAITGDHKNRLQQEVDLAIPAHIVKLYYDELDMSSRFPLSLILDFIIITYVNEYSKNK